MTYYSLSSSYSDDFIEIKCCVGPRYFRNNLDNPLLSLSARKIFQRYLGLYLTRILHCTSLDFVPAHDRDHWLGLEIKAIKFGARCKAQNFLNCSVCGSFSGKNSVP
jgi:hypothetical protein